MGDSIEALKEIEKLAIEIYSIAAERFPEYKDIWVELQNSESRHLTAIALLKDEDLPMPNYVISITNTVGRSLLRLLKSLKLNEFIILAHYFEKEQLEGYAQSLLLRMDVEAIKEIVGDEQSHVATLKDIAHKLGIPLM